MPKKRAKQEHDFAVIAHRVVEQATGEVQIDPLPPATGTKLGGQRGGAARAKKLSPEQRREVAKKAAASRWSSTRQSAPR